MQVRFGEVIKIYQGDQSRIDKKKAQHFFDAWVAQKITKEELKDVQVLGQDDFRKTFKTRYSELVVQKKSNSKQIEAAYLITNGPRRNSLEDYKDRCQENIATLVETYGWTHLLSFRDVNTNYGHLERCLSELLQPNQKYYTYKEEAKQLYRTSKGDIFTTEQPDKGRQFVGVNL